MLARLSRPKSSKEVSVVHPSQSLRPTPASGAFVSTIYITALAWLCKRHSLARVALLREPLVRLVSRAAYWPALFPTFMQKFSIF